MVPSAPGPAIRPPRSLIPSIFIRFPRIDVRRNEHVHALAPIPGPFAMLPPPRARVKPACTAAGVDAMRDPGLTIHEQATG